MSFLYGQYLPESKFSSKISNRFVYCYYCFVVLGGGDGISVVCSLRHRQNATKFRLQKSMKILTILVTIHY